MTPLNLLIFARFSVTAEGTQLCTAAKSLWYFTIFTNITPTFKLPAPHGALDKFVDRPGGSNKIILVPREGVISETLFSPLSWEGIISHKFTPDTLP